MPGNYEEKKITLCNEWQQVGHGPSWTMGHVLILELQAFFPS